MKNVDFFKLMKKKPLVFQGTKSENSFVFYLVCNELLYKIGIIEIHDMEFVYFSIVVKFQATVEVIH